MTDYTKLVEALREAKKHMWAQPQIELYPMMDDAADAIEAMQAEVQFYEALAEEWQSAAENKERLLGLYRAEQAKHFYSATEDDGRVIQNPCACLNIPVFSDSSESPNS